jgi:hypothetical protein
MARRIVKGSSSLSSFTYRGACRLACRVVKVDAMGFVVRAVFGDDEVV